MESHICFRVQVKMGVALEDLIVGHSAGFDFDRRVMNDKGEQGATLSPYSTRMSFNMLDVFSRHHCSLL